MKKPLALHMFNMSANDYKVFFTQTGMCSSVSGCPAGVSVCENPTTKRFPKPTFVDPGFAEMAELQMVIRFHTDRAAGGDSHHWNSRGDAAAGFIARQIPGGGDNVPEQQQATGAGLDTLFGGQ